MVRQGSSRRGVKFERPRAVVGSVAPVTTEGFARAQSCGWDATIDAQRRPLYMRPLGQQRLPVVMAMADAPAASGVR